MEIRFAPPRKWRFDYAWPELKLAVEQDGGAYSMGRHTRGSGFIKDMEKLNHAAILGWHILRFTPAQVTNGYAALTIQKYFEERKNNA
jgi:very-short-patch-repair endonuclease